MVVCSNCGEENPRGFRFCGFCGTQLASERPQELRKTVTVYVSKGRQPITVANWTHQDAERATRVLERLGLNVDTEDDYSDTVPKGAVISQSPEAGTTLHKGDTVTLLVSNGPPLVEVPSVAGSGVGDATRELEDAGFKVNVEHYTPYFGLGFVMRQDGAGEKLPRGSTITIWIS